MFLVKERFLSGALVQEKSAVEAVDLERFPSCSVVQEMFPIEFIVQERKDFYLEQERATVGALSRKGFHLEVLSRKGLQLGLSSRKFF